MDILHSFEYEGSYNAFVLKNMRIDDGDSVSFVETLFLVSISHDEHQRIQKKLMEHYYSVPSNN